MKIRWRDYQVRQFTFPEPTIFAVECGAYALHSITEMPTKKIMSFSKNGHWPTKTMFSFLKSKGYKIIPATLNTVVNSRKNLEGLNNKITSSNVLLLDLYVTAEDSTWAVTWRDQVMHSGDVDPLDPLTFINTPICRAYVIWHKKWR